MVLKPWMQDPGSSWGRDPRLLSSERDRVPCVSTGEGQGPLCVPGGGGQDLLCVHRGRAGPPVCPWGRGAGPPVCPLGRGQGPLCVPGEGGRVPWVALGAASGVQATVPVSLLPEQRWTSGQPGAACLPLPQRPPLPCPSSGPAAGRLSGRPSVWPAVCLAGRLIGRPVGERSCCVCSEPALGHSAGHRVGLAWGRGAVGSAHVGVHCSMSAAGGFPGPWPGVGPQGASVPGARSSHLFTGRQGGLSPWEDEAGRSGEPGWAQRLLLGARPAEGRPRWVCGVSRAPAGCLAGSSWLWAHQGGPGGVAQLETYMKPRTRVSGGLATAVAPRTAGQAPCPCGRPCSPLDRASGDPGHSVSCALGGRTILLWDLTPDKPHGQSRPCKLPTFSLWLCLPRPSSGLRFAPGPLRLPALSGCGGPALPVGLPSPQAPLPAPSPELGGGCLEDPVGSDPQHSRGWTVGPRSFPGAWQTVSLAPGPPPPARPCTVAAGLCQASRTSVPECRPTCA